MKDRLKDRLFLDTNIILDLLGEREPHYQSAARIATLADEGKIDLVVSALTFATTFYVLSRFEDKKLAKEKIRKLKVIVKTSDLTDKIIDQGLSSNFSDFEDSLQYFCAMQKECNFLITRNVKDFKSSIIPVLSPDEYLSGLQSK